MPLVKAHALVEDVRVEPHLQVGDDPVADPGEDDVLPVHRRAPDQENGQHHPCEPFQRIGIPSEEDLVEDVAHQHGDGDDQQRHTEENGADD